MSASIRINYIYMDSPTFDKFSMVSASLGWAYRSLAQQCIHAFFGKHRDFYAQAALEDAAARGMDAQDYYAALYEGNELPEYKADRPIWDVTPLGSTPCPPTIQKNRRRYNTISLGDANYVFLRAAEIVHESSTIALVSRIIKHHFDEYWARSYQPQIDLHKHMSFQLPANNTEVPA